MNKQQILNLADVGADDFEAIQSAIEDWKACGLSGKFTFVSEQETQECMEVLKEAFQKCYNKGAIAGGIATLVGFGVGVGIWKGYEHFKAKKGKKVE